MTKFWSRPNPALAIVGVMALAAALGVAGCSSRQSRVDSPADGLPSYTAEEAALFDDGVAPAAFGLEGGVSPSEDPIFYDRLKHADAVLRGRISTVTEASLAGKNGYALSVQIEASLRGSVPEKILELRIPPGSVGLARMQASGTALVGKRVLLFVRKFGRGDDVEMHFHADADDPKTREALKRTKPLDETANEVQTGK